jgi:hypothetical protein
VKKKADGIITLQTEKSNREYTPEELKESFAELNKTIEELMKTLKGSLTNMTALTVSNHYNEFVSSMALFLQKELSTLSTYELQKNGIDSRTYKRIMKNPEKLKGETVLTYLEKVEEIKKSKKKK